MNYYKLSSITMKYTFSLLFVCFLTSMALAQPGMMPMRDAQPPVKHGPFKDSVEFKTEFNALYPLIRPTPNVRERAQVMLTRMSPMFKSRGMDSARAYDSAMKSLDLSMDEKILFDAYRAEFSAEELKSLAAFFKTPAGKHYLEVEPRLVNARTTEIDQYIARTVYHSLMPMMPPSQGMPHHRGMIPPNPNIAPPPGKFPRDTVRTPMPKP